MKRWPCAASLAVLTFLAIPSDAQSQAASTQDGPPLARELVPARQGARLRVTSPAFSSGSSLDERYTQNGENLSPPLEWNRGPNGTQSYVVLAEDPAVSGAEPVVHWIVYNIPSTARGLRGEMPSSGTLPNGALQGKNASGTTAYLGPKPPAGQTHPYHFQVFALSSRLDIDPASADRTTVLNAMKGRVLASGGVVGVYGGE
jgi:Raf kinase inhibitor-like YbhB/YbcL family protein